MSQNSGSAIGKLVVGIGAIFAMAGRACDDVIRLGARSADEFAVVGDDMIRSSDDILRYSDDVVASNPIKSSTDELINGFDDVFIDAAQHGGEFIVDEMSENEDSETEFEFKASSSNELKLLDKYNLQEAKTIFFMKDSKKYDFNDTTRKGFLKILAGATPIERPNGKSQFGILYGKETHWITFGENWIGIRKFTKEQFEYYALKANFKSTHSN